MNFIFISSIKRLLLLKIKLIYCCVNKFRFLFLIALLPIFPFYTAYANDVVLDVQNIPSGTTRLFIRLYNKNSEAAFNNNQSNENIHIFKESVHGKKVTVHLSGKNFVDGQFYAISVCRSLTDVKNCAHQYKLNTRPSFRRISFLYHNNHTYNIPFCF
ncbi:MAG: hypothetical protein JJW01_02155 [Alphaproteobacteria bacterium]|nr:hypothetical protein [Rickettsiales bacterium]